MPDLKAALTEALRGHRPKLFADDDQFAALADVLLALPGVAVIQLPEPQADWHGGMTLWKAGPHRDDEVTIRKSDGRISFGVSTPFDTPMAARMAAAALLAAAVLSEGSAQDSEPQMYIDVQVGSQFHADCDCGWSMKTGDHVQLEAGVQQHTDDTGHIWPNGPIEEAR